MSMSNGVISVIFITIITDSIFLGNMHVERLTNKTQQEKKCDYTGAAAAKQKTATWNKMREWLGEIKISLFIIFTPY